MIPATLNYSQLWYRKNREKALAMRKAWRLNNPNYSKVYHKKYAVRLESVGRNGAYKRKYGISLSQYNELLQKQNGTCALCLKPPVKQRLAVDHSHSDGKIRGLLCVVCNRVVLGRIDTIPGFLGRLLNYVR